MDRKCPTPPVTLAGVKMIIFMKTAPLKSGHPVVTGVARTQLILNSAHPPSRHAVFMEEMRGTARADALAAADEGVRRGARGGASPSFLKAGTPCGC